MTVRIVLLGDSTATHNAEGRLPLDDPRLYENVIARSVEEALGEPVELTIVARAGTLTTDMWRNVTKDPWLQQRVLPGCDAVVMNFAGGDSLPVGFPTWVKDLIPRIPSPSLRKRVRTMYWRLHAPLVRWTRGRLRTVPRSVSLDLWPRLIDVVRWHSGGAPMVTLTIQPSRANHHGSMDPHSEQWNRDLIALAEQKGVTYFDNRALCAERLRYFSPVDGMHWDDETHEIIGETLAGMVVEQIRQRRAGATHAAQPGVVAESGA